jgi:hypothetical protein
VDPSALSEAARALRRHLVADVGVSETQILIGHPALTIKDGPPIPGKHFLNLFFYRIEPGGYPADGAAADPVYIRLHCLITPVTSDDGNGTTKVSAGENDLRLLGAVVRVLHAQPVLSLYDSGGHRQAQLQVVPAALSLDDLNHVWSTQGSVQYRPSAAYELALVPVPLAQAGGRGPLVTGVGVGAGAGLRRRRLPEEGLGIAASGRAAAPRRIDPEDDAWIPELLFLKDGVPCYSLTVGEGAVPARVDVICIGRPGATVSLLWELWDRTNGWGPPVAAIPATLLLGSGAGVFDPEAPAPDLRGLAIKIAAPTLKSGQAALYASRPDGRVASRRSNPVLLNVLEAAP